MAAPIPTEVDADYDLAALVTTDLTTAIPSGALAWSLANPPFVSMPGTINFRSLGWSGNKNEDEGKLAPGVIYRSGNLSRISDEGKEKLFKGLGIKKIFDLRLEKEVKGGAPPSIEGVEVVWMANQGAGAAWPNPADFAVNESQAYIKMYNEILKTYRPPFKAVLSHVLDTPGVPFVFHCTGELLRGLSNPSYNPDTPKAGKDRTGVLSAIILSLCGYSQANIATDYALTRIGAEPGREMLLKIMVRDQGFDLEAPGMMGLMSSKASNMLAFLSALQTNFGGAEGYVESLGFGTDEIERIKANLKTPLTRSSVEVAVSAPAAGIVEN